MNKIKIILISLFLTPFIAGLYGIIHDQITYSISEEYFTKFKFIQFHINEALKATPRLSVALIGFLATWWVGLFIGIVFSICFLTYKSNERLFNHYLRAVLLTFITTCVFSIIGFFIGKYSSSLDTSNWYFPDSLINKTDFIIVGNTHNYSYIGGIMGLGIGVIYLLYKNDKKPKYDFPKMKSITNKQ